MHICADLPWLFFSSAKKIQMGTTTIFFLLSFLNVVMAVFLVFELGCVGGEINRISLSYDDEEEDMELERQLKVLNNTARKSFEDFDGSVYDCVDINKQATLNHPLLKNREIQMKPPSLHMEMINETQASSFMEPADIGIKGLTAHQGQSSSDEPEKKI